MILVGASASQLDSTVSTAISPALEEFVSKVVIPFIMSMMDTEI